MSADFSLQEARVGVLGLGLMGGSLALALKGRCREVVASDPDPGVVRRARQLQIASKVEADPASVLPGTDLVLLAAPVRGILSLLEKLPQLHPGKAVVIDIGSTKRMVCESMQRLPARFDPVGGHPMCGKAAAGLEHAQADLFRGATFAFTRLHRSGSAVEAAVQLAQALECQPLWIDAETHDRWVAATSHLPYLLALALSLSTPLEAAPLVGPGFRSASRLAGSSAVMMEDILATNTDNLLSILAGFQFQLGGLQDALLQQDSSHLRQQIDLGAERHAALIRDNDARMEQR